MNSSDSDKGVSTFDPDTEQEAVDYGQGIRTMRLNEEGRIVEVFDDTENSIFLSDEENQREKEPKFKSKSRFKSIAPN